MMEVLYRESSGRSHRSSNQEQEMTAAKRSKNLLSQQYIKEQLFTKAIC
jgi:hypothetical protein